MKNNFKKLSTLALTAVFALTSLAPSTAAFADVRQEADKKEEKTVAADIANHWAGSTLAEFNQKGYLKGDSAGLMHPNKQMSRAEYAAVINRMMKFTKESPEISQFNDVKAGDWFYSDMAKALKAGYMKGTGAGTMSPQATLTREQAFVMLYRLSYPKGAEGQKQADLSSFADGHEVSSWAKEAVSVLVGSGAIKGELGRLNPSKNISRAESVTILSRSEGRLTASAAKPEDKKEEKDIEEFTGTGAGYGGTMTLKVIFEKGKIADIKIVSERETSSYLERAKVIIPQIIAKQGVEGVDNISGATKTCNAIKDAVKDCVSQQKGQGSVGTVGSTGRKKNRDGDKPDGIDYSFFAENLREGEFEGEAKGYGGDLTVRVKVIKLGYGDERGIESVNILDHSETQEYFDRGSDIIYGIKKEQSTALDAIGGATITSNAIMTAVERALNNSLERVKLVDLTKKNVNQISEMITTETDAAALNVKEGIKEISIRDIAAEKISINLMGNTVEKISISDADLKNVEIISSKSSGKIGNLEINTPAAHIENLVAANTVLINGVSQTSFVNRGRVKEGIKITGNGKIVNWDKFTDVEVAPESDDANIRIEGEFENLNITKSATVMFATEADIKNVGVRKNTTLKGGKIDTLKIDGEGIILNLSKENEKEVPKIRKIISNVQAATIAGEGKVLEVTVPKASNGTEKQSLRINSTGIEKIKAQEGSKLELHAAAPIAKLEVAESVNVKGNQQVPVVIVADKAVTVTAESGNSVGTIIATNAEAKKSEYREGNAVIDKGISIKPYIEGVELYEGNSIVTDTDKIFEHDADLKFKIVNPIQEAKYYYTFDGSEPTESSMIYNAQGAKITFPNLYLDGGTLKLNLKIRAVYEGNQSEVYESVLKYKPAKVKIINGEKNFKKLSLRDGVYKGTGNGYGGNLSVTITVNAGSVTSITVDHHNETPSYFRKAKPIIDEMLARQSTEVDTKAGATMSSSAIISAVEKAVGIHGKEEFADGIWYGQGRGYYQYDNYGTGKDGESGIGVKVEIKGGKIRAVNLDYFGDDQEYKRVVGYMKMSKYIMDNDGIGDLLSILSNKREREEMDVSISGATRSAKGYTYAVNDALTRSMKYKKDGIKQEIKYINLIKRGKTVVHYGEEVDLTPMQFKISFVDSDREAVLVDFVDLEKYGIVCDHENNFVVRPDNPSRYDLEKEFEIEFKDTKSGAHYIHGMHANRKVELKYAKKIKFNAMGRAHEINADRDNFTYNFDIGNEELDNITDVHVIYDDDTEAIIDSVEKDTTQFSFTIQLREIPKTPETPVIISNGYPVYSIRVNTTHPFNKDRIERFSIIHQPDKKMYTVGETLDLSGLRINAGDVNRKWEEIPFEKFAEYGFRTDPEKGTALSNPGSTNVRIIYKNAGISEQDFAVEVKAAGVVIPKPDKIEFYLGDEKIATKEISPEETTCFVKGIDEAHKGKLFNIKMFSGNEDITQRIIDANIKGNNLQIGKAWNGHMVGKIVYGEDVESLPYIQFVVTTMQ